MKKAQSKKAADDEAFQVPFSTKYVYSMNTAKNVRARPNINSKKNFLANSSSTNKKIKRLNSE